ncbi:hypothetical protein ES703_50859 [subsurface metagenome]
MAKRKPKGWFGNIWTTLLFGPAGPLNIHGQRRRRGMVVAPRKDTWVWDEPRPETVEPKCPCSCFKNLDLYWQKMDWGQKHVWNAAVKKPHMTGYNLFMKEGLSACYEHGYLPKVPSVSGGYSPFNCPYMDKRIPPAGEWIGKAPIGKYHCTGAPT